MRPDAAKSAILLREARLRAGLSQAALAERSGVHRVQINRYEAGAVAPSLDTLIELVRACDFDLPLELVPRERDDVEGLAALQLLSPERRLERMLERLSERGQPATRKGFDPLSIIAALERSYVDYVLIGGFAQALRGADVTTVGVDLCPSFARRNLDRLDEVVRDFGASETDGGSTWSHAALSTEPVFRLETPRGELGLVASPAGVPNGFVALRAAATRETLAGGLRPLVAATGDLAAMAAALHRDQDVTRLPMLRRVIELEVAGPPAIQQSATQPLLPSGRAPAAGRRAAR